MRRLVNIIYGMMKYKTAYELPVVEEKSSLIRFTWFAFYCEGLRLQHRVRVKWVREYL